MAGNQRRPSARERLRQERERQARQRQRSRALVISGAALAVVAVVVVIVIVLSGRQQTSTGNSAIHPASYQGPFAPVTLNADGAATMARPGLTSPVLVVYEDFQCPICADFEKVNGPVIQKLAYQGKVKVVYRPFTIFLGSQPRQDNSVRAWAAARCVPAGSWLRYHNLLYANQPPETQTGGFPVSQLLRIGERIGLTSAAFRQCVSSQRYANQAIGLSESIIKGGVTGTPTVTLNGRPVSNQDLLSTSGALRQMILSAH